MIGNNKGFTAIEVILVLLVIAALAFAGWTWYQANMEENDDAEATATEETTEEETGLADGELIELDPTVRITSADNLDSLPEETPESFIAFMEEELDGFDEPFIAPDGETECRSLYEFDLVSAVNVRASLRAEAVDPANEGSCAFGGGGQYVWYLADDQSGEWGDTTVAHTPLTCQELTDNNIYEEFIQSCVDDAGNSVSNPNGSITQLAS